MVWEPKNNCLRGYQIVFFPLLLTDILIYFFFNLGSVERALAHRVQT